MQPQNTPPHILNKLWLDYRREEAIRLCKAVLRKFKPTTNNVITYKLNRTKAHKAIKEAKKMTVAKNVSKINSATKLKSVWKKIAGKYQRIPVKHLAINNSTMTN